MLPITKEEESEDSLNIGTTQFTPQTNRTITQGPEGGIMSSTSIVALQGWRLYLVQARCVPTSWVIAAQHLA